MLLECRFEALEPFVVFGDSPDVRLKDDVLGWSGADDIGEPAQVGGASVGVSGIAASLA
jgi:hypothetical protein